MLFVVNKGFSISLVVLLLVSVTGVSVNTHYCHGMARYTVLATDADHSSCCGDEMDACPSCEDRVQSNVMDDVGISATQADVRIDLVMNFTPETMVQEISVDLPGSRALPLSLGPPGKSSGSAIPILFQTFLI